MCSSKSLVNVWQAETSNYHCWQHHGCWAQADHSDHNQAFNNLLQTAQKCNVKLDSDKLQYKEDEVIFVGETYITSSHKPARSKVSPITAMPPPTNKKQIQSSIGVIDYLSKFSMRLSELAEPIRELSKDKVPFCWGPEHQAAFTHMKQEISSAPMLAYYNPKKQTMLQTGASIKGLGACLLHEEKPLYFASKALTDVQKGYVAIEIELPAVAWAMEKFHYFLYASPFILETDKKPLEAIVKEFEPSNSKITADTDQDFCLPLYSKIYTWC